MYDFILQLAIVISLGAMVYLMARALHRVPDGEETVVSDHSYFDQWLESVPFTKLEEKAQLLTAKFLRRIRIIVLKFDNLLHRYISSMKSNGASKSNIISDLNDEEK